MEFGGDHLPVAAIVALVAGLIFLPFSFRWHVAAFKKQAGRRFSSSMKWDRMEPGGFFGMAVLFYLHPNVTERLGFWLGWFLILSASFAVSQFVYICTLYVAKWHAHRLLAREKPDTHAMDTSH